MKYTNGKLYKLANGVIVRIEHNVVLDQTLGHYYCEDDRKIIGARGWEKICATAGVSFIKPPDVLDESGVLVANPVIKREQGSISHIRLRQMLIGRGESGNLCCYDLTLSYGVREALSNALFDAWVEGGCKEWAFLSNEESAEKAKTEKRTLGSIFVSPGVCLIYDMANMFVVNKLREHAQFAASADRAAESICARNLARKFFGFTDANSDGSVTFYSWVSDDVNWQKLISDGEMPSGVDTLVADVESTSEKEEESQKSDNVSRSASREDIANEVNRIGGWQKARAACKDALSEHGIKWGDIGTTSNQDALEAILKRLRGM